VSNREVLLEFFGFICRRRIAAMFGKISTIKFPSVNYRLSTYNDL
jgi:hypothetical protein